MTHRHRCPRCQINWPCYCDEPETPQGFCAWCSELNRILDSIEHEKVTKIKAAPIPDDSWPGWAS